LIGWDCATAVVGELSVLRHQRQNRIQEKFQPDMRAKRVNLLSMQISSITTDFRVTGRIIRL